MRGIHALLSVVCCVSIAVTDTLAINGQAIHTRESDAFMIVSGISADEEFCLHVENGGRIVVSAALNQLKAWRRTPFVCFRSSRAEFQVIQSRRALVLLQLAVLAGSPQATAGIYSACKAAAS